jgi:hypothetical protein
MSNGIMAHGAKALTASVDMTSTVKRHHDGWIAGAGPVGVAGSLAHADASDGFAHREQSRAARHAGDQSRADAGASQGRRHGIAIRVAPS